MHNKNNPTLIKANFIKTANFLEDLVGDIFNNCLFGKMRLDVKNKSRYCLKYHDISQEGLLEGLFNDLVPLGKWD